MPDLSVLRENCDLKIIIYIKITRTVCRGFEFKQKIPICIDGHFHYLSPVPRKNS